MTKELRRVSVLLLAMFLALFGSASYVQVLGADELSADPRNVRELYASYSAERGPILVAGLPIVESVPVDDAYQFQRQYPDGPLYAPVTGYFTLDQGNAGIEAAFNDELTGQADTQFFSQLESLISGRTPEGAAVALTLNPAAQQAAAAGIGDRLGAAVALDPTTGAILAMVSSPSFDPNLLASHDTPQVIASYDELLAAPGSPLLNRAIGGDLFTPGSVFKLVVLAAALQSGRYTLDSTFPNPQSITLPGSTATVMNADRGLCPPGTPEVSLADALIYSCNVPFAQLAGQLGASAIRAQAEAFGFGQDLEVPMAVTPSQYPSSLDPAQLMLTGFGQFDVRVTPLQMAMISAAIANGGRMMQPTLVDQVIAPNLAILSDPAPEVLAEPITPAVARTLYDVMIRSVTEGLATNAAVPGATVGGKTGTAERGEGESYNLWFTGFAERDGQQVVVAVVVQPDENNPAESSNTVSATIAQAVIEAVLNS